MKHLFGLSLILVLSSCAVQVQTSYDPSVDFGKYKSFCWLQGCDYRVVGPSYAIPPEFVDKLKTAIETELISIGFVKDEDFPDFMVDFHVVLEERTAYFTDPFDHAEAFETSFIRPTEPYTFLEGSIVIDIVDQQRGVMIWRADLNKYLDIQQEVTQKQLSRSMGKAFKKFPPDKPKK